MLQALSDQTRLGLGVLAGALAIGIAADALLRVGPWGVNFSLFVTSMVIVLLALGRWQGVRLRGAGLWMTGIGIVFGVAYAWRDSPVLQNLNVAAVLLALALLALYASGGNLRRSNVGEIAAGVGIHFLELYLGVLPILFGIQWKELQSLRLGALWSVVRGLLIAIPTVLLFGKLLSSADAVFDAFAREVFRVDLPDLIVQILVVCSAAYFASAWLYRALARPGWNATPGNDRKGGLLGTTELVMVLGGLDVLFAIFVLIQARYFFGGADVVAITPDLTFAEYARRGFFELVWVSGLALPLLLLLDALRKRARDEDRLFRVLSAATTVLLFVVMVSAVQRMRLYVDEFGLTELRLYPTVFMAWLAIVFVWFGATVLGGDSRRFAFGAIVAGFATLAALNALNPDALIARVNLERPATARAVDLDYLLSLSADAAPVLVDALPTLPESEHQRAADRLLTRWLPLEHPDWRTFNAGRDAAREALNQNRDRLFELASPIWRFPANDRRRS
jgi:hypothetical protein